MYKGDIFAPYMGAPKYKYIPYSYDAYAVEQYGNNYIGEYQLNTSTTYFLCQKDGTYKISINYRIEYLATPSDTWKRSNKSYIEYVSSDIITKTPKGTDKIYLYGVFNGTSKMSTSTASKLTYNESTKSYDLTVDLVAGDTFRFYIDVRSIYINYLTGSDYATAMFEGAGLVQYGTYYWQATISGTYEISISYKVEYLDNIGDIWKSHGDSCIEFIGSEADMKSSYVVLGDNYSDDATYNIKVEGNTNIYQYTPYGMLVEPTSLLTFDGQTSGNLSNSIIKIDYNPTYSQTFTLTISDGETTKSLTATLIPNYGYSGFDELTSSSELGEACAFLYDLESYMGSYTVDDVTYEKSIRGLSQANAVTLKSEYNALSSTAKEYVDASLIYNEDENVTVLSLIPTIKKMGTLPFTMPTEVTIILIAIPVLLIVTLFLLGIKRRDDQNILTFDKDEDEENEEGANK